MSKLILVLLFVVLTVSCAMPIAESISFDSVTREYLGMYGEPEEIDTYTSGSYQTIDWWYWSQDVCVSFINSPYDNTDGWRVNSIYTF